MLFSVAIFPLLIHSLPFLLPIFETSRETLILPINSNCLKYFNNILILILLGLFGCPIILLLIILLLLLDINLISDFVVFVVFFVIFLFFEVPG